VGAWAGMSDEAVKAATGKDWKGWIAALDKAGAAKLPHRDIAKLMRDKFVLASGWWCQMVTVGYEQAKGLRDVHQTASGYTAGVSKTMAAPASAVYAAWSDARKRKAWLPDPLTVRTATPAKSLRITWHDGTRVDVYLTPKVAGKTQVAVQHERLPDAQAVAAMKAFWKDALGRLADKLA
jgi:uncharacterized protein YndB with AHSA1/START domain